MVNTSNETDMTLLYWKRGERNFDRSSARTRLFSKASNATAMAQPMK